MQSEGMNDQWAAENLQTIRTLMERAAVYRRALAPVMSVTGVIGLAAALAGWKAEIAGPTAFVAYWLGVALVAVAAGGVLMRRQALQQSEPFWSPPTRRVFLAMLPPLLAGFILGLIAAAAGVGSGESGVPNGDIHLHLPLLWVILYGCAVHAAGFVMRRGIRLFGWMLILLGCAGFLCRVSATEVGLVDSGYAVMGLIFGLLHLLYGLYLFASEKRSTAE